MTEPFDAGWLTVVLGSLKRRKFLFLFAFVVLACLSLVKGDVRQQARSVATVYTSRMRLLVTPPQKKKTKEETGQELETWFASEELLKHLVVSEDVLARTVIAGGFDEDWKSLKSKISFFEDEGKARRIKGSFMLNLEIKSDSAESAEKIAQVLEEELVDYTQDLAARELIASRKLLEQLAIERKGQIEQAQQSILAWRNENDIWDINKLNETQSLRVQSLEADKTKLLSEARVLQVKIEQIQKRQQAKSVEGATSVTDEIRALSAKKNELDFEIRQLRQVYKEGSQNLSIKLEEYAEVSADHDRAVRNQTDLEVSVLAKQRNDILARASSLNSDLADVKGNKGLAKAQVQLQKLQYELSVAKNNYEDVLRRIDETKVQEQVKRNEATFILIEKPTAAQASGGSTPGHWKKDKILSGLVLSLVLAGMATFLFELFSKSHSLRNQIDSLGLPLLSVLPITDLGHLGVMEEPKSILAEQIRRMIVGMKRKDTKINSILVTSCWPSEGKSFVSSNLAASLTRFGLSVTLVDADIRKPFLTKFFQKEKTPGLRQVIEESGSLEDLIESTEVDNLDFLPAGTGEASPTELFSNASGLFAGLCDSEDKFLIIDSAPISVCSDSIQLSDEVEAVILVVNSKQWTARAELEYLTDLEEQGVNVLGVVLNGAKNSELTHAHGYGYGRVYGQYYGQKPE